MAFSVVPSKRRNNLRNPMKNEDKVQSVFDDIPSNEKTEEELFEDKSEETDTEETPDDSKEEEEQEDTAADSPSGSEGADNPSQGGGDDKKNTSDDKDVPFHKHPRFKEIMRQRDEAKQEAEKLQEKLGTLEQDVNSIKEEKKDVEVPDWFADIAGTGDEAKEAYRKYLDHNKKEREEIKKEILETQTQQEEQQKQEQEKWDNWVNDEVDKLRDSGEEFDKNELMKTALEYKPEDDEGNISLPKALEILKLKKENDKKKNVDEKKKVASKTGSDNRGSETKQSGPTPEELRRGDIRTLINKYNS